MASEFQPFKVTDCDSDILTVAHDYADYARVRTDRNGVTLNSTQLRKLAKRMLATADILSGTTPAFTDEPEEI